MALAQIMKIGSTTVKVYDDYIADADEKERIVQRVSNLYYAAMERMTDQRREAAIERVKAFERECAAQQIEIVNIV